MEEGIPKCGREDTKVWKRGYQSVEEGIPKCDQRCKPREKAKKDASLRAKAKKRCRLVTQPKSDAACVKKPKKKAKPACKSQKAMPAGGYQSVEERIPKLKR